MNEKARSLYEAHVAFVLSRLDEKNLPGLVAGEASFIWEKLASVKLADVITKEEILDFQKRNFEHREKISDPARSYFHALRDAVVDFLKTNPSTLADVVDKKDFDALMLEISRQKEVRERIIHEVVSNPLYAEVIANSLADGIKSFTSEEGLAGKIPGASSFFKMGQGLLGGLQDSIDRNIRKFVSENIHKLTSQSERFVQNLIDDRKVRELGEKAWKRASATPVSKAASKLDAKRFEPLEPVLERLANHALRSGFARDLNDMVVDHFLKENGGKSLQQLLLDIEISEKDVVREATDLFVRVARQARSDGSLEARVRKHLSDFYGSPEAAALLG